jgi:hypothetical protein
MTNIPNPIIIVGTGRCGSTVFHRLLARHPRVMWLSGFCDHYPTRPALNRRAVVAVSQPILGRLLALTPLGRKVQPGECYKFWDKHAFGFSEPCRDLVRSDVSARVKRQVHAVLGAMLTPTRDRLLIKITGWPRIGYLDEIFNDAKFIHIMRDGRAVASSLLHVNFWRGWHGPQGWRAGLLSAEDQATWESYDRSFTALAGLEWRIQMRAIDAARRSLDPERFLEVKYEDFCDRPLDVAHEVLKFAELPGSDALDRHIEATAIKNSIRWRDDLTVEQQKLLDDLLRDDLIAHGYADPASRPAPARLPLANAQR